MTLTTQEQNNQDYYYFDYDWDNGEFSGKDLPEQYNANSIFLAVDGVPSRNKHYCQKYQLITDLSALHGLNYSEHILINLSEEDLTHLKLLGLPINKVCTPAYKEAITETIKHGVYYHDFD